MEQQDKMARLTELMVTGAGEPLTLDEKTEATVLAFGLLGDVLKSLDRLAYAVEQVAITLQERQT